VSFRTFLFLNVTATVLTVLSLAVWFPSRQLRAARTDLEQKGFAHAASLAAELTPEMLDVPRGRSHDPDIAGVLLLRAGDENAHTRPGVHAPYTLAFADRIAVVNPLVANGLPYGSLIVELSTTRLEEKRAETTRTVLLGGSVACLLGLLLAIAIARVTAAVDAAAARDRAWAIELLSRYEPANDTLPLGEVQVAGVRSRH
jgi:hypothetical protein